MPQFYIYSNADLGLSSQYDFIFTPVSTSVQSGATLDILRMSDDDVNLDDEGSGAGSTQILTEQLVIDGQVVGQIGDIVQNIAQSDVVNSTTGEVGQLMLIQINGVVVGYTSTIPLSPGDSIELGPWIGSDKTIPYDDLDPTCFTRGTLILCKTGAVRVEDLAAGDRVLTRDNGMQEIRWISHQKVDGRGRFAPVRFAAGAIGNTADLLVSPMHRMLVSGWRAELMFGKAQVLAHAIDLCDGDRVFQHPTPEVEYFHLLFDRHEIISAHGCWSESFAPTAMAMDALETATRNELLELFPHLADSWRDACPTLLPHEAALLLAAC